MEIDKVETKYKISNEGCRMTVSVNELNGRLTILNTRLQQEFIFQESDPKVVKAIGELLIEASKLCSGLYS